MSTSFSVSRDDVIKAALRKQTYIAKGETPTPEDYSDMAFALNLLIKSWVKDGIPMWKVLDLSFPGVINLTTYSIGPNVNPGQGSVITDKPLRILSMYIRDLSNSNNMDVPINNLSIDEYTRYSRKSVTGGRPNSALYIPGTTSGQLIIYPPVSIANQEIHLFCQTPLLDVNLGTDTVDFPAECFQALVWNLADETAEDNSVPAEKISRIAQKAAIYKMQMANWSQEEASLYFTLDRSGR